MTRTLGLASLLFILLSGSTIAEEPAGDNVLWGLSFGKSALRDGRVVVAAPATELPLVSGIDEPGKLENNFGFCFNYNQTDLNKPSWAVVFPPGDLDPRDATVENQVQTSQGIKLKLTMEIRGNICQKLSFTPGDPEGRWIIAVYFRGEFQEQWTFMARMPKL